MTSNIVNFHHEHEHPSRLSYLSPPSYPLTPSTTTKMPRLPLPRLFQIRSYATPSSIGTQSHGLKGSQIALLPPIPLYRRILRAHRKFLPREMRVLGDEYVKAEFRAHKETENPVHIVGFLTEWQGYAQQVEVSERASERGASATQRRTAEPYNKAWSLANASDRAINGEVKKWMLERLIR